MKRDSHSHKLIVIILAVVVFLAACYSKENFVNRNRYQNEKGYASNISQQDVNKFLSSVRKVDGNVEAKYRLARHFQQRKKHKIALEALKEVIQIDPGYVKAYNAMGVSYDHLGDFKKAIQSYELALKINPNLDYVYNNLGFAYLLGENYRAAIDAFQKAIALNDQNKRFRNNLGFAYAKKGQFDLALEQFRITGDEFSANYRLGQILYNEGNYEMAFRYNEKAYHAKALAEILSSPSQSAKEKNSDVSKVPEKYASSEPAAVSPDFERTSLTSLKNDEKKPEIKSDIPDKKINIAQPNHLDSAEAQLAANQNNEDLMMVAKREDRKSYKNIVEVEIEVLNGNGVNGMANRLGNYLRKKGFKVTRLANANSFSHAKTKIFYYNGHIRDVYRLLQEIPVHQEISHVIELKHLGNRIKILIGKDMTPFDQVISKDHSTKQTS